MRRSLLMAARLLVLLLLALTGLRACGGGGPDTEPASEVGDTPRPLTPDEADRLAVMRFNNYDRETANFSMRVPVNDQVLTLSGRTDFRKHRSVAWFVTDDEVPSYGLIAWDLRSAAVLPGDYDEVPAKLPAQGWQTRALDASSSTLDATLLLVPNLAVDRPENPQLLRQNGAQWVGSEVVEGTAVDLMRGPTNDGTSSSRLTYAVDASGNLLSMEVDLGLPTKGRIDLPPGQAGRVGPLSMLRPG